MRHNDFNASKQATQPEAEVSASDSHPSHYKPALAYRHTPDNTAAVHVYTTSEKFEATIAADRRPEDEVDELVVVSAAHARRPKDRRNVLEMFLIEVV